MTGPTPAGTTRIMSVDAHDEGEPGRVLLGAHLLVRATTARVRGGRVEWVQGRNVPSFALALDQEIQVRE